MEEEIMEIMQFIEDKLNFYAGKIKDSSGRTDEHALGELTFYMALRRVLAGKGTPQDLGVMDAINDTLEQKGILRNGVTFLK